MYKAFRWLPWLFMGLGAPTFAAIPPSWKQTAYAFDAQRAELSSVLEAFAREFGVNLEMDPLEGIVEGRIRSDSPQAFLDRLGQQHQFQWFVFSNTLYVSATSEQITERIEVSSDAVDDLKDALTELGLLDSRFGWGVLPDEGVVLVSGPARYVQFIRDHSSNIDKPEEKQEVVVLPLRYANAADRTIRYRDEQLTVSGVATILKQLLDSRSQGGSGTVFNMLQGTGLGSDSSGFAGTPSLLNGLADDQLQQTLNRVIAGASGDALGKGGSAEKSRIRVAADERNNAVLIYDSPKRRALYRDLVKQLDVPRNVIEIDAVIYDIDRDELAELSSNWHVWAGGTNVRGSLLESGSSSTLSAENAGRFALAVRTLEGKGAATVVSNPSILTLENQPAVIDFSRTEFLTATGERVADIQPITAGTSLQVIPRSLQHNGATQVQLILDIEDGQIEASLLDGTKPSVRNGSVSTQAVIAERGSLVVGGFHSLQSSDKVSKIPWLSDIPLIGRMLFTSSSRSSSKVERLFILTPRIVGNQIDPARYVESGSPEDIDSASQRIEGRHGYGQPTRVDIQRAFTQLLSYVQPAGFTPSNEPLFKPSTLCASQPGLLIDADRSQWYGRNAWSIGVIVARNTGDKPMRIDESNCGGRWVLGVSAWPRAWLQPGEQSEIYVAVRNPLLPKSNASPRDSLLVEATR